MKFKKSSDAAPSIINTAVLLHILLSVGLSVTYYLWTLSNSWFQFLIAPFVAGIFVGFALYTLIMVYFMITDALHLIEKIRSVFRKPV